MSSTALVTAEFLITAGVVLGFCAYQLWSLNKLARDRAAKKPPDDRPDER